MRQPFVTTTCRHHRETAGTRPIDQITNKGGLIAKSQGIHHASKGCFSRKQRATKRIRFHRDIDHVLAMLEGSKAMLDRCDGVTGAFHHHIDTRVAHQRAPIFCEESLSLLECLVQGLGLRLMLGPTHTGQIGFGARKG